MMDLLLWLILASLAATALYGLYRSLGTSVPPSQFENQRTKRILALVLAAEGLYQFARYGAETEESASLLLAIGLVAVAGLVYLDSLSELSDDDRRWRDRVNALVLLVGMALTAVIATVPPEDAVDVAWYSAIGVLLIAALGIGWRISHGWRKR